MMYHLKFSLTGGAARRCGSPAAALLYRIFLLFRHCCALLSRIDLLHLSATLPDANPAKSGCSSALMPRPMTLSTSQKYSREDEDRDDHDGRRRLEPRRATASHLAHLAAHVLEKLLTARPRCVLRLTADCDRGCSLLPCVPCILSCWPFVTALDLHLCSNLCCRRALGSPERMAGELGFEPRSSVLETDSLTVELTPLLPFSH